MQHKRRGLDFHTSVDYALLFAIQYTKLSISYYQNASHNTYSREIAMKNTIIVFTIALFSILAKLEAQEKCGTMQRLHYFESTDTAWRSSTNRLESAIQERINETSSTIDTSIVDIPVVIHIVWHENNGQGGYYAYTVTDSMVSSRSQTPFERINKIR